MFVVEKWPIPTYRLPNKQEDSMRVDISYSDTRNENDSNQVGREIKILMIEISRKGLHL